MREDALVGVDVLLDGDLIRRSLLEVAAHAHVQPFGVLAHDDEVDGRVSFQGGQKSGCKSGAGLRFT